MLLHMSLLTLFVCYLMLNMIIHVGITGRAFRPAYKVKYFFYQEGNRQYSAEFPYRGYVKVWYIPFWIRLKMFSFEADANKWLENISFLKTSKLMSITTKQT